MKNLIIFGTSSLAECAYEYFTHDSEYDVCAFCVDATYIEDSQPKLFDLPIISSEDVLNLYPPQEHAFFVAIGSQKLNRLRNEKVQAVKKMGYSLASYVSSKANIWSNVKLGEHVFIQEDNTIQPFVKIGNNVVLWAGNHIGHGATIEDNCFITSHVVISGHCTIGENSFVGVNASIADTVQIGKDNFIGMNACIVNDTPNNRLCKSPKNEFSNISARRFMKVHKR